jgi:hypothetical protein
VNNAFKDEKKKIIAKRPFKEVKLNEIADSVNKIKEESVSPIKKNVT